MATVDPVFEDLKASEAKSTAQPQATQQSTPSELGASARIIGLSLLVGTLGSILIYQHEVALGTALWVFVLVGSLFLLARVQKVRPMKQNLLIVVPVLFFAAMLAVRYDGNLSLVNFGAGTFAALLLIHFFAGGNIAQQDLAQYGLKAVLASVNVVVRPVNEFVQTLQWFDDRRRQWGSFLPVVRGLLITLPVVVIFIALLSSADSVFGDMVDRIVRLFTFRTGDDLAAHIIVTMILAWVAIGGFAYALHDHKAKRAPSRRGAPSVAEILEPDAKAAPLFSLGFTETTMLLSSVCAVFAAFVAVQFVYLFGGSRNIDVTKFNYADYVHRGFAELIMVGLLTLGMAYFLNIVAIRRTHSQLITLRSLLTVLIVLTGVILISAFERMRLYEEAYGFTTLRRVIEVFIVWLGLLFVGFALSLYWQPVGINVFGLATLIAVFGFAATLDLINPDAFVARELIANNDIDPKYLVSLSDEAVPAMVGLIDAPQRGLHDMVVQELMARKTYLLAYTDWRDYSVGRSMAAASIYGSSDKLYAAASALRPLTLDDFAFLRKGLSYREVLRQAGNAFVYFGAHDGNVIDCRTTIGSMRDGLIMDYDLADHSSLYISVDTADGVTLAYNKKGNDCQLILK